MDSARESDLSQLSHQGGAHTHAMLVVRDGDRYFRDMRVVGDHVVGHPDQPPGIEGAEGTPGVGFSQLARELLQMAGTRGEEAQLAVIFGQVLMQDQDRVGVLDPKRAQQHPPSVEQVDRRRVRGGVIAHGFSA